MRRPERARGARREGLRLVLLVSLAALVCAGCSRLTFVKPDLGRGEFVRTAPEVDITTDPRDGSVASARTAVRVGQQYLSTGELQRAAQSAQQALELDPGSAAAHTLAALVADRRDDADRAEEHYRRAVELAPAVGGMLNNYGVWLCHHGRARESLEWFDRALADRNYATPAAAMANAGVCASEVGMSERAGKYLRAALQLEPENPVALGAMAEREFRAGRAFHARAFSQRRLAAAPPTAAALWLASQIEQELGDTEAAARYVQRMRTEFPDASGFGTGDDSRK